jgi:hypothetical protein
MDTLVVAGFQSDISDDFPFHLATPVECNDRRRMD